MKHFKIDFIILKLLYSTPNYYYPIYKSDKC